MLNVSAALSALRSNQVGLTVVGNNVANANTPDYHRQDVRLAARSPVLVDGLFLGQGVDVAHIDRAYQLATEQAITRNIAEAAGIEVRLQTGRQLEGYLTPGHGSVNDRLESLFNELQRLTTVPDDAAARTVVVRAAQSLAQEIGRLDDEFNQMLIDLRQDIDDALRSIERTSADIIDINRRIREAEMQGQAPNDLRDQRDSMVNDLAQLIDIEVETQKNVGAEITSTEDIFRMANGQLTFIGEPVELRSSLGSDGHVTITKTGSLDAITVVDGKLGGLLISRDEIVMGYQQRLNDFVKQLIQTVDSTHATGLGLNGPFTTLLGQRGVSQTDIPLANAETTVPIEAGSLFVSVSSPNGTRTLHEVVIDPSADSLEDVAARISGIADLQAAVDSNSGRVSMLATPGFAFDFTGRVPTDVDTSLMSGTATPSVHGAYQGSANVEYTVEFTGNGTIGTTVGLQMNLRDSSGGIVSTFAVGQGYSPDSALLIGDGVQLALTAGDVVAGDQFSLQLVGAPDTTGFLAAIGLNTLFVGESAGTIGIDRRILDDPARLATSKTGEPRDSLNAIKLLNQRYEPQFANSADTFEDFLSDVVASVGVDVGELTQVQDNLNVIGRSLRSEQQSVSGVDPNEEAIRMLQFQRGFQAAARYVAAIDETLDELLNMLR